MCPIPSEQLAQVAHRSVCIFLWGRCYHYLHFRDKETKAESLIKFISSKSTTSRIWTRLCSLSNILNPEAILPNRILEFGNGLLKKNLRAEKRQVTSQCYTLKYFNALHQSITPPRLCQLGIWITFSDKIRILSCSPSIYGPAEETDVLIIEIIINFNSN